MTGHSFNQADKEKLIKLLNTVADKAVFSNLKVNEIIELFSLLAWAQKELLTKVDSHILEVTRVVPVSTPPVDEAEPVQPAPAPRKRKQ